MNSAQFWTSFSGSPHSGTRRLAIPRMIAEVPPHERRRVLALVFRRQPFLALDLAEELNSDYAPGSRRETRRERERDPRHVDPRVISETPIIYGTDRDEAA